MVNICVNIWRAEPWFDMYLENRDPLAININPQLTWQPDPNPEKMNQVQRASSLIASSIRFYRTLRDGHLEVLFLQQLVYLLPPPSCLVRVTTL